jgi:hypothetical protein
MMVKQIMQEVYTLHGTVWTQTCAYLNHFSFAWSHYDRLNIGYQKICAKRWHLYFQHPGNLLLMELCGEFSHKASLSSIDITSKRMLWD